jgi:nucleoside-diphosphate-sugar epimerase
MTEKLLIIGCGDIGQRLARRLAPADYAITGLRRRASIDLPYLQYHQGDVTQADQLTPLLAEGFDVIVISMTPAERSDEEYKKAYVDSCQQLIIGLNQQSYKPRLILFVSSTAVYAQNNGEWVDESSPTLPGSFSGKRLLEAERIILGSGYSSSVVRFSGIYGPGRHRLIEQVLNQRASASSHYTNRIHAEDCAAALAHLIERAKLHSLDPIYLVTDSNPTPMVNVVSWIAEQLNLRDFLAADAINERGNKRIANKRLLDTGFTLGYPDFKAGYSELLDSYPHSLNT